MRRRHGHAAACVVVEPCAADDRQLVQEACLDRALGHDRPLRKDVGRDARAVAAVAASAAAAASAVRIFISSPSSSRSRPDGPSLRSSVAQAAASLIRVNLGPSPFGGTDPSPGSTYGAGLISAANDVRDTCGLAT